MSNNSEIRVLFVEPFYGGSHKQLIDVLRAHPKLQQSPLVSLNAKKWHWRARCGALMLRELIPKVENENVLFCSSVVNLGELLGLRPDLQSLKKIVYFHENQLVYPVRVLRERDVQYAYNEIITCLAADVVLFNSNYNRNSFLENIAKVVKLLPDYKPKNLQREIEQKSTVLYFPITYPNILQVNFFNKSDPLHIVWPHRWEFDKAPQDFFNVLYRLKADNLEFIVSVLGETFEKVPTVFDEAKTVLKDHIVNFGYVANKQEYYQILCGAHVVVSTALHEFFGVAMLEAASCGCFPLVPNRLVYPEIYPKTCLYSDSGELYERLKVFCLSPLAVFAEKQTLQIDFEKYSSITLLPEFIKIFSVN